MSEKPSHESVKKPFSQVVSITLFFFTVIFRFCIILEVMETQLAIGDNNFKTIPGSCSIKRETETPRAHRSLNPG